MTFVASVRSLSRLSGFQRLVLAEGMVALALASLAIRLAPFKRVVQAAGSRRLAARPDRRGDADTIKQCRWAVNAWADRVPWKAVCFQRGLALHLILRRRGVPSVLHYGVAHRGEEGLAAHVWISFNNQIVLGGDEAAGFTCVASFPTGAA